MSNANRTRGRKRELGLLKWLNQHGWVPFRVDGSGDVIAGKNGVTLLIQCKSTIHPYDHFGPEDRLRLSQDAAAAGWFAYLWWCPKGCGVSKGRFIPEYEWPDAPVPSPRLDYLDVAELDELPIAA